MSSPIGEYSTSGANATFMRISIVYPKLPPAIDGIGDHTRFLAEVLARADAVEILTSTESAADSIPGIRVRPCFSMRHRSGVEGLLAAVEENPPDWLFLQYNPFAWGCWGLNLHLPLTLSRIKSRLPRTRIALMAHERYVPIISWRFAVMTSWQRLQLWMLARLAHLIFVSIEPWAVEMGRQFPNKPVIHLPVGSNIPAVSGFRESTRRALGLDSRTTTLGVVGSAHPSRMPATVARIVHGLVAQGKQVSLVCAGTCIAPLRAALPEYPVLGGGPLPADDVSKLMSTMDVVLSLFVDGVSTRRSSFMSGLEHGRATVATIGEHTDRVLSSAAGKSFLAAAPTDETSLLSHVATLIEEPTLRASIGAAGMRLYEENFAWEHIANIVTSAMTMHRP